MLCLVPANNTEIYMMVAFCDGSSAIWLGVTVSPVVEKLFVVPFSFPPAGIRFPGGQIQYVLLSYLLLHTINIHIDTVDIFQSNNISSTVTKV